MSPRPFGPGKWQIDSAAGDPDPTPVTTIAWRLGHLHLDVAGSWEWTFGERRRPPAELVDFSPSAAVALERFWAAVDRWRASVAAVTPEQLDTVGYCQYPWSDAVDGSDRDHRQVVGLALLVAGRDPAPWLEPVDRALDPVGPSTMTASLVGKPPFGGAAALDSIRSLDR